VARKHHYKRRTKADAHEIDVTTFLNLMVVLVPFLLITAVFSRLTIVELDLPSAASGPNNTPDTFRVEVVVREEGIEISNGSAVIATIPKKEDEFDLETLSDFMVMLKRQYPSHDAASVLMEPQIPYDYLIQVRSGADAVVRAVFRDFRWRCTVRNSRRIKRMSRNRVKITKMNLTSLMDVFTILVFFLLVNSGSVEILEAPKNVLLPESKVESKPRETVVISVSPEEIMVQGQLVAMVADLMEGQPGAIDPITARLSQLKNNIVGPNTRVVAASQEVTILADRSVPFAVVKKIMSTCTGEGFENVSLAVIQKPSQMAAN
jgi:biopolymer transport protein ExbD